MILQCNQLQTPYRKCLEFRNRMLTQKRCLTNKYWNNQMTSIMYQNQASGAGRSGQTASRRSVLFHTASTTNQHIIVLMKHQSKARWCIKEPFTNGKLHATKVSHTHTHFSGEEPCEDLCRSRQPTLLPLLPVPQRQSCSGENVMALGLRKQNTPEAIQSS